MQLTQKNANAIQTFEHERMNALRQFNPKNELIYILEVVERKEIELIRPMTGFNVIDQKETQERGHKIVRQAPPQVKHMKRHEKDYAVTGPLDEFWYRDPDDIDETDGLPRRRFFKKGEQFKAPETKALYFVAIGQAKIVPFAKDADGKTIADEKGVLLPELAEKYRVENITVWGLMDQMEEMRREIANLKEKK